MTVETHGDAAVTPASLLGGGGGVMGAMARAEVGRAMAEVLAQVQVAQAVPRNVDRALTRIEDSCRRYPFAQKAFYAYPRGRRFDEASNRWVPNIITGPSVYLARELASAFGNMQYGLVEVERDSERGLAVMRAYAWDVETNAQTSSTFVVRHVRDKKGEGGERSKEPLFDERDIYERNANDGARRVRAAIFGILPAWYLDHAIDLCNETNARGPLDKEGKVTPLPIRMAKTVDHFLASFGVRKEQLEEHLGVQFPDWRPHDLTRLLTLGRSLQSGDLTLADVFPPPSSVTDDMVAAQAAATATAAEPPPSLTEATRTELDRWFAELGLTGRPTSARRQALTGLLATRRLDLPELIVPHGWRSLTEPQGQAALAELQRRLAGTAPADRAGLIEQWEAELADDPDEPASQAAGDTATAEHAGDGTVDPAAADKALSGAATSPPRLAADAPAGPITDKTAADLNGRLDRAGLAKANPEVRLLLAGALVAGGHFLPLDDLGGLTEAQAWHALATFDALAKAAEGAGEPLRDKMKRVYDAALAERDAQAGPPCDDDADGAAGQ